MPYPRACPLCRERYDPRWTEAALHVTVAAVPGGTPSPWRPDLPGRVLTLQCRVCRGTYRWDYFAEPTASSQPPERAPRRWGRQRRVPRLVSLPGSRSLQPAR